MLLLIASYPDRSYYGPPSYQCGHCHAVFWYGERVKYESSRADDHVIYNNCCRRGKISIPAFQPHPEPLASLATFNGGPRANHFMKHIRQYNCLFAFTSMGPNIDRSLNDGRGPPIFKVSGQVHHRIGSLLPPDGSPPKFLQLYIYDTANEISNRMRALRPTETTDEPLDSSITQSLIHMLDQYNPFARSFRMARDRLQQEDSEDFIIRIIGAREGDSVQYNLPTADQLALLVVGDFSLDTFKRDIVIQTRSGDLHRISSLHPAYMALQYPLLFPYGERGYQVGVLYNGLLPVRRNARTKISMRDYFCYMFHYRNNQPNPYLSYGLLSSQAKVDARASIDESRLSYILDKQPDLRVENIQGISDAVDSGCVTGSQMGKMTILPSSFTGGRRYMVQNYHDAIAICRVYGPPDFFVTFTCNAKWPEITESLEPGQRASDRSDIVVRVFNMKLEELLHDIRSGKAFGPCPAGTVVSIISLFHVYSLSCSAHSE